MQMIATTGATLIRADPFQRIISAERSTEHGAPMQRLLFTMQRRERLVDRIPAGRCLVIATETRLVFADIKVVANPRKWLANDAPMTDLTPPPGRPEGCTRS